MTDVSDATFAADSVQYPGKMVRLGVSSIAKTRPRRGEAERHQWQDFYGHRHARSSQDALSAPPADSGAGREIGGRPIVTRAAGLRPPLDDLLNRLHGR